MTIQHTDIILEMLHIACLIADCNLRVTQVTGHINILSSAEQESRGRSLLDVVLELIGNEATLDDILNGQTAQFELCLVNREATTGSTLYVNLTLLLHHNPVGKIDGLIYRVQELSEMGVTKQQLVQHRNELRLLQAQRQRQNLELSAADTELRRLDELKSQFVAIAFHELRSPLFSIHGYIYLLLADKKNTFTAAQRAYLDTVQGISNRLVSVANNLLDVSHIDTGQIELYLVATDLNALIQTLLPELNPQLEAQGQELTIHCPAGFPPILCDRTRTGQVLINLLSNASKYTPAGGNITLTLTCAAQVGFIQVAIKDTGLKHGARAWDCTSPARSSSYTGAKFGWKACSTTAPPSTSPSLLPTRPQIDRIVRLQIL